MYIFTYFCIIELVSGENQQINIPSFNIFYRNNYKHTDNAIPEIVMMNGSKNYRNPEPRRPVQFGY